MLLNILISMCNYYIIFLFVHIKIQLFYTQICFISKDLVFEQIINQSKYFYPSFLIDHFIFALSIQVISPGVHYFLLYISGNQVQIQYPSKLFMIDHDSITYRSNKSNQNNRSLIDQIPDIAWWISVRLVKLINRLRFENWYISDRWSIWSINHVGIYKEMCILFLLQYLFNNFLFYLDVNK
jgi:hypothetical protein